MEYNENLFVCTEKNHSIKSVRWREETGMKHQLRGSNKGERTKGIIRATHNSCCEQEWRTDSNTLTNASDREGRDVIINLYSLSFSLWFPLPGDWENKKHKTKEKKILWHGYCQNRICEGHTQEEMKTRIRTHNELVRWEWKTKMTPKKASVSLDIFTPHTSHTWTVWEKVNLKHSETEKKTLDDFSR